MKFVVIVLLMMNARPLLACTCRTLRTVEGQTRISDAVFTATIVAKRVEVRRWVGGYEADIVTRAQVARVWKGDPPPTVRISTGIGGGDCGIHLDRGETYLVFANGTDAIYGTGVCKITARRDKSLHHIAALGPPRARHGNEDVPPNNPWAQRFMNLWSALVVIAVWWWRWPALLAMAAAIVAAIFIRERILVPVVAWLISWGVLAYDRSWLELNATLWLLLGGMLAAVVYAAVRTLPLRKLQPVVPAVMPAAMVMIEWPQFREDFHGKFSVLGFLLGAWSMPTLSYALTFAIPFLLLTLLWIATLSRRWSIAIPAALLLASIAVRASGPWPGLLQALQ